MTGPLPLRERVRRHIARAPWSSCAELAREIRRPADLPADRWAKRVQWAALQLRKAGEVRGERYARDGVRGGFEYRFAPVDEAERVATVHARWAAARERAA